MITTSGAWIDKKVDAILFCIPEQSGFAIKIPGRNYTKATQTRNEVHRCSSCLSWEAISFSNHFSILIPGESRVTKQWLCQAGIRAVSQDRGRYFQVYILPAPIHNDPWITSCPATTLPFCEFCTGLAIHVKFSVFRSVLLYLKKNSLHSCW